MPSILQFKVLIKKNHLNIRCARLKISNDKEYSKEFISYGALLVFLPVYYSELNYWAI